MKEGRVFPRPLIPPHPHEVEPILHHITDPDTRASFVRESGDPGLLARYREREEQRLMGMIQHGVQAPLERSGRLRAGISASEAVAVIWTMSAPDLYTQLVFDRGWTPARYEEWLGDALINALLSQE